MKTGEWILHFLGPFGVTDWNNVNHEHIKAFAKSGIIENQNLEFKGKRSVDGEDQKIGRAISGFSNSNGGLLFVGLAQKDESGRFASPPGQLETISIKKESFEQKIRGFVEPYPKEIHITPVDAGEGLVFLVEVPGYHHPPVQSTKEFRYYERRNFINDPMPAHRVQEAFERMVKPRLVPIIEVHAYRWNKERNAPTIFCRLVIANESSTAATQVFACLCSEKKNQYFFNIEIHTYEGLVGTGKSLRNSIWEAVSDKPIYGGTEHIMTSLEIVFNPPQTVQIVIASIECPSQSYRIDLAESIIRLAQDRADSNGNIHDPFKLELHPTG